MGVGVLTRLVVSETGNAVSSIKVSGPVESIVELVPVVIVVVLVVVFVDVAYAHSRTRRTTRNTHDSHAAMTISTQISEPGR
jgi:Mg2+/citrate symporter